MSTPISHSVVINRPLEDVFAFVTDFRNDKKWWKPVTYSEMVTSGEFGVGSEFIQHAKVMFVPVQNRLRVLEISAPNWVRYRNESNQLAYDLMYKFEAVDGGTRFSHDVQLEMKGVLGIFKPLTMWFLNREQRKYFGLLKEVLESEAA